MKTKQNRASERKVWQGLGREWKGREGKGREGKGKEGKGRERERERKGDKEAHKGTGDIKCMYSPSLWCFMLKNYYLASQFSAWQRYI